MPPPEQRPAFPDKAHEDLATWVEETFQAIGDTQTDVTDSLWLVDVAFGLIDQALADLTVAHTARGQLQQRVTDLEARLDALETPEP